VLEQGGWDHLSLPAIAEQDEVFEVDTPDGTLCFRRARGEVLHAEREPAAVLAELRRTMGEYSFAAQYQQSPVPLDGGLVKRAWLRSYRPQQLPECFALVLQSWDTANKATELSDYSVCTSWGVTGTGTFYLLDVLRARLDYPALKRTVREQAVSHRPDVILIEDKGSGTQLIQELTADGLHQVTRYEPGTGDKVMRMHAQTARFESGHVLLPESAPWLSLYQHELTTFPGGKHDDQVDSTAQALHWCQRDWNNGGIFEYCRRMYPNATPPWLSALLKNQ
jgi:predicted phage terminase large subunit-like protein